MAYRTARRVLLVNSRALMLRLRQTHHHHPLRCHYSTMNDTRPIQTAQHGASWASPTAKGACRAGTRPRVCGVASRTPVHPVVHAPGERSPAQCQHVAHAAFS